MKKIEKKKKEKLDKELEEIERSSITPSPRKKPRDMYKAEMEWLDRRNAKLIDERAKKLENEVFIGREAKPRINKKSKEIAASNLKFEDRQRIYIERKKKNQKLIEKEALKRYTFTPRINPGSKKASPEGNKTVIYRSPKKRSTGRKVKTERPGDIKEVEDGIIVSGFYLNYDELDALNQRSIEVFNRGDNIEEDKKKKHIDDISAIKEYLENLDEGDDDAMFYDSKVGEYAGLEMKEEMPIAVKKKRKGKRRLKKKKKKVKKVEGEFKSPMRRRKKKKKTSKSIVKQKKKNDVSSSGSKTYRRGSKSPFSSRKSKRSKDSRNSGMVNAFSRI